jgi:mono/diheme cytochrome c family protein
VTPHFTFTRIAMTRSAPLRRAVGAPMVWFLLGCTGSGGERLSDTVAAPGPNDTAATPGNPGPPGTPIAGGGEALFQQRCMSCHQATGEGIPGTYPPLAGSEYANAADPGVPARIVIHGLTGPLTVKGATYNGLMPPYGTGVAMTDEEIASVLTYVRSSFGNTGSAVSSADVQKAREATRSHTGPMTADVLRPLMGGG